MSSKKQILLNNAWAAWRKAIYYCDLISAGRASFDNRKSFISALHNSVELFLKQIMLDQNDHRVCTPKRLEDAACDVAMRFYVSKDLNAFFRGLKPEELNLFVSIEFNQFFDLHKKLLQNILDSGDSFKNELKLLAKLRNDETHFFVDPNLYVTENEFKQLYNFMNSFYKVLEKYHLLPFWGRANRENKYLVFKRKTLSSFSYADATRNSSVAKLIKQYGDGLEIMEYIPSSAYEIAEVFHDTVQELQKISFDELWEYTEMLQSLGMLRIVQVASDFISSTEITYCSNEDSVIEIPNYAIAIDLS